MQILVRVRDVMDKNVIFAEGSTLVSEVIKMMLAKEVWSVVITQKGLPSGVVTDRDILRRCIGKEKDPRRVKAEEIMSSPLIQIGADSPVGEAMNRMLDKKVRRLYIVEKGKVIGRVSQTSLMKSATDAILALSSTTL